MKIDIEKLLLFIRAKHPRCLTVISHEIKCISREGFDGKHIYSDRKILAKCIFESNKFEKKQVDLYSREKEKVTVSLNEFNNWMVERNPLHKHQKKQHE